MSSIMRVAASSAVRQLSATNCYCNSSLTPVVSNFPPVSFHFFPFFNNKKLVWNSMIGICKVPARHSSLNPGSGNLRSFQRKSDMHGVSEGPREEVDPRFLQVVFMHIPDLPSRLDSF